MFITQISLTHAHTNIIQDLNFLQNFPRVFLGGVGRSLPGAINPASLRLLLVEVCVAVLRQVERLLSRCLTSWRVGVHGPGEAH